MSLTERITAIPWQNHPQPEWNKSNSVRDALFALHSANDVESCSSAYEDFLFAVGNNHAGTYYPVLSAAMPLLEEILSVGKLWPTRAVLCLLDDLCASFQPEPGYETVQLPSGTQGQLAVVFKEAARNLSPLLTQIARQDSTNSVLAKDLLALIHEDEA